MQLFQASVCQIIIGSLMDVSLGLDLVIIREAVHFVDKHFKVDLWIDSVCPRNGEVKPAQGLHIIILKRKKAMYKCACVICTLLENVNVEAGN